MTHPRVLLATATRTDGGPERPAFLLLRTVFIIAPFCDFGLVAAALALARLAVSPAALHDSGGTR